MQVNDFAPSISSGSEPSIRNSINSRFQKCPLGSERNIYPKPFLTNYTSATPKHSVLVGKVKHFFHKEDSTAALPAPLIAPFPSLRNINFKDPLHLTEEQKKEENVFLFFKNCPLDVQKIILSNTPLETKLGFRASCKGLNHFILEKTNFWQQVAQKLIETEIPPTIQSAFGGIDFIRHFPIIHHPSEAKHLRFAIVFTTAGRIGLIAEGSLYLSERTQSSVTSRKLNPTFWDRTKFPEDKASYTICFPSKGLFWPVYDTRCEMPERDTSQLKKALLNK